MSRVLVIEDDTTFALILNGFLKRHGFEPTCVSSIKEAIVKIDGSWSLILLDYRLPDGTGMDVLDDMAEKGYEVPVIMMTSFQDIRTAVRCIRKGAYDYITKPVNHEELLMLIREACSSGRKRPEEMDVAFVKGDSAASRELEHYISLVAGTDMSVLLQGESGTGKEHLARAIHSRSKRAEAPFVAIDCGALSPDLAGSELFGHIKGAFTGALQDKKGHFEFANGGTIFLDEVGNLNYEIQVKLLRALQEREIQPLGSNKRVRLDVRIITATNEDMLEVVRRGQFREDLYHRINEFKIRVPSLAERRDDLLQFVDFFIQRSNRELDKHVTGISPELQEFFFAYEWPGNIRELKNVIKRAVLLARGDRLTIEELPEEMKPRRAQAAERPQTDLKLLQEQTERALIISTLEQVNYNKSKAAKLLNIDRTTLYNKLARYGIEG